jgi:RNA polymerase sigma-32 factor
VGTAVRYRRYGVDLGELVSEGNVGLVHALNKFEPDRGYRFVTYAAYWIRAYILNYIIRNWSLVGGGSGALRSKMFFKLRRERAKLAGLVGDSETAEAMLAEQLGLPQSQVSAMLRRLELRDMSLDAKVFDDGPTTLGDTLTSEGPSQEEEVASKEVREAVKERVKLALEVLDPRERYIVESRLLSDPEDQASLADLGRKLGVSRERARQLEVRAKRKLKSELDGVNERLMSVREAPEDISTPDCPPGKRCA